jgi:hypothetical protein
VSPTVPFDLIAGYAAGAGLALSAADPLSRTKDPARTRYFASVVLFAGLVWVPAGIAMYLAFPDWSLMYFANPEHLPLALALPVLLILYFGTPMAGFFVTHQALVRKDSRWLRASAAAIAILLLIVVLAGRRRLMSVAYYDDFQYGGPVLGLFQSSLILPLSIVCVAVVGAFVATVRRVQRHVRASLGPLEIEAKEPAVKRPKVKKTPPGPKIIG